jgi:hypothetical protein
MIPFKMQSFHLQPGVFFAPVLVGWMTMVSVPISSHLQQADPDEAERKLADTIRRELQQNRHKPWEAVYHGGIPAINQSVTRLFLSKKRGYVCIRTRSGDMGTVHRKGERFILTSRYGDWGPGHATNTKEFVLVPWGSRLYLIETNRIVAFCNAINAGDEPRTEGHDHFLLREGDWKKKVKAWPSIPKLWGDQYLLKSPVVCIVRAVRGYSESIRVPEYPYTADGTLNGIRATINAGKKRGLRPGMTLFPQKASVPGTAYVLSCKEDSSEVLLTHYLETEEKMKKVFKTGVRFSTRKMR